MKKLDKKCSKILTKCTKGLATEAERREIIKHHVPMEFQYKKYINLKTEISELEVELKRVGEMLKQDIIDNGNETVDTKFGSFYLTRRKKYEYSPAVNVLETTLKETKKEEEQTGLATVLDETVSLTFRGKKNL